MINKVPGTDIGLPPNWMARIIATTGQMGDTNEVRAQLRKMLGDPKPAELDLDSIPPELAALFTQKGVLQKIRKKLEQLTKKQAKRLAATKGRVACVDENDVVYVGVDFLERFKDNEDLLAGVMAHEWGHMLSPLPDEVDLNKITEDEMNALRRDEEAGADAFAGKALYIMGYSAEELIDFLKNIEMLSKKIKSKKYHPVEIREAILKEAFAMQKRNNDTARRIFLTNTLGFSHVLKSTLIGEG